MFSSLELKILLWQLSVFSKSSLSQEIGLGKRTTTKTPGGVPEVGLTWDNLYECRSVHSFHKITLVMG